MARVTVEDCVLRVENYFELVVLAAARSRQISAGAPLMVERDNDKNPVVALREIGDGLADIEALREVAVTGYRHFTKIEPMEQELDDMLELECASTAYITEQLFDSSEPEAVEGDEPELADADSEDDAEENLADDESDED